VYAGEYSVSCTGSASTPTDITESSYTTNDTLTLTDGGDGYCQLDAALTVNTLNVNAGVTLTHVAQNTTGITITATNVTVDLNGAINVDGKGYVGGSGGNIAGSGTGGGQVAAMTAGGNNGGGGAGYGAAGGTGNNGATGGISYGSETNPVDLGSGGGAGRYYAVIQYYLDGGNGGGLIHIAVTETFTLNGVLSANGTDGQGNASASAGGGSGGTVYISAQTITGSGTISAIGGTAPSGPTRRGGGGAGGRTRLEYVTNTWSGSPAVTGGSGANAGGTGTTSELTYTVPSTPSISSPLDLSYNASQNPTIASSAYTSNGAAHATSDWKVTTDSGGNTVVWSAEDDATNRTSIITNATNGTFSGVLDGATQLVQNTSYYVFVRHTNMAGDSSWSTGVTWKTVYTGITTTQTWEFDEVTPADSYTYNTDYVDINASSNSLAQLKDLGSGTYEVAGLAGWSRLLSVTVTNNIASDLTNFQVRVPVTYDADMQVDFDDIRFTTNDGTTLVDYWLETKIDSTSAVFWVEVPSIPASASTLLYMQYGNSTVSSASSADDTFIFIDEFSGPSLAANWTEVTTGGASTGTFSSGQWTKTCVGSGECDWWSTSDLDAGIYITDPGGTWEAVTLMTAKSTDSSRQMGLMLYQALKDGWMWVENAGGSLLLAQTGTNRCTGATGVDVPVYLKIKKIVADGGDENYTFWHSTDGSSWTQCSTYTATDTMSKVGLFVKDWINDANTTTATFDYFYLKQYAATEPTVSLGSEIQSYTVISITPSSSGAHPNYNQLYRFTETLGSGSQGSTAYQIGVDTDADGVVANDGNAPSDGWYYVDGTTWTLATTDSSHHNSATTIDNFLSAIVSQIGTGNVYFKVFLISNGTEQVKIDRLALTYGHNIPETPSITSPANSATGVAVNPTFASSAYSSDGAAHTTSSWKITTDSGGSTIVWSKDNDATNLTSIVVNTTNGTFSGALSGQTALASNTTYYPFILHTNSKGDSSWSATSSFTTVSENSLPIMSGVLINSGDTSINLTENSTTAVNVIGTATDTNGCSNLSGVSAKLYRTTVGVDASDDDNNHYSVSCSQDEGSCLGGEDNTATYTCAFSVQYYADPTDASSVNAADNWTTQLTPSDSVGAGTADTDTIEMNSLTALNVTASINFGELALGNNTDTTNQTTTITNTGNEGLDVNVSGYGATPSDGYAMTCTIGTIAIANAKYSTSTFDYDLAGTALASTTAELDLDIPQRTGTVTTGIVYWGIGLPSTNVGGSCSGTIVFGAVSDPSLD